MIAKILATALILWAATWIIISNTEYTDFPEWVSISILLVWGLSAITSIGAGIALIWS
jgi:hypothetical protein